MGALIVVGTTVLMFAVVHRLAHHRPADTAPVVAPSGTAGVAPSEVIQLAPGTHIAQITGVPGGLALLLTGGGPDRVVIWRNGALSADTVLSVAP
ncbi:hypothetical protein KGY14_12605 [Ameyamaea chiangmaiensis]|uniref:Uncharacterized protein n=2 Tax=Ameyamaea chiangmaiensis TaxID=442969 RepID=A0A850PG22_9PROT|nr:hypothetical protein [Ameyamaea chiangmaiensis]NVN40101.1 hypothetical protein [Ameyamaea chiangmaiensis]